LTVRTDIVNLSCSDDSIVVKFLRKNDWKAIRQLEFASRLLHSFKPDNTNTWRAGHRLDFYMKGFHPTINWEFPQELLMIGTITASNSDCAKLGEELRQAIEKLCPEKSKASGHNYSFAITDGSETFTYHFNKRARSICALAVLFDLEWHPRKDLEIWINPSTTHEYETGRPFDSSLQPVQLYGDPSKTADELRNEGWSRDNTDSGGPFMIVESRSVNGQSQQHYKLTTRVQPTDQQTKRSVIKQAWRQQLFSSDGYTCQICLSDHTNSPELLAPDHRVPVIFRPDDLDDQNFLTRLMTLCRFCNQSKREFAKRVTNAYDWETSPWAYPERYRIEIVTNQLSAIASESGKSLVQVTREYLDHISPQLGKNS
jgi:hypothetical protein